MLMFAPDPTLQAAPKPTAAPAHIQITGVSKRFTIPGGEVIALKDIDLAIGKGEFVCLLGPSGCGKSTLLNAVAGFSIPSAGTITVDGRAVTSPGPDRGMVFQEYALFPWMTVAQNVAFGLEIKGMARADITQRVGAMLERVGLAGAQAKGVDQLSGGQKQRVAIARSLVLEPTLLLLDEPLGALDLKLREHMKIELKQLQAAFGTTFVYITHDQSEALVLSDQVAVMNAGRFEQLGTPQSLYYEPLTPFVAGFVGANNRIAGRAVSVVEDIVELATPEGLTLHARRIGTVAAGDTVEAFVRPEVASLARSADELPFGQARFRAEVESLLFDGANSAVLLRESSTRLEVRIALPQTGQFKDLVVGEHVAFGFDPQRAVCFRAAAHAA